MRLVVKMQIGVGDLVRRDRGREVLAHITLFLRPYLTNALRLL